MKLKYKTKKGTADKTEVINRSHCEVEKMLGVSGNSSTSTPLRGGARKAVSLLDISQIGVSLQNETINASTETLGSTSSICKDSGYNLSESSLASDKNNLSGADLVDFKLEYFRLLDDLKFKDVLISSLHESNHKLRLKMAEAENKISELRFKSQTHCPCCHVSKATSPEKPSLNVVTPQRMAVAGFKYSLSTFARSEPCLLISRRPQEHLKEGVKEEEEAVSELRPEAFPLAEDPFSKVKEWQHSLESLRDSGGSRRKPTEAEEDKLEEAEVLEEAVVEPASRPGRGPTPVLSPCPRTCQGVPLPKNLSYMETSRALAESYRRRQEQEERRGRDLFSSFQVVGNHSISVAPLHLVQGQTVYRGSRCETQIEPPKDGAGRRGVLNDLIIRNQKRSCGKSLVDILQSAIVDSQSLRSGLSELLPRERGRERRRQGEERRQTQLGQSVRSISRNCMPEEETG